MEVIAVITAMAWSLRLISQGVHALVSDWIAVRMVRIAERSARRGDSFEMHLPSATRGSVMSFRFCGKKNRSDTGLK
jgi:hypothetical protein